MTITDCLNALAADDALPDSTHEWDTLTPNQQESWSVFSDWLLDEGHDDLVRVVDCVKKPREDRYRVPLRPYHHSGAAPYSWYTDDYHYWTYNFIPNHLSILGWRTIYRTTLLETWTWLFLHTLEVGFERR